MKITYESNLKLSDFKPYSHVEIKNENKNDFKQFLDSFKISSSKSLLKYSFYIIVFILLV